MSNQQRIEEANERIAERLVGKTIVNAEVSGDLTHGGDGFYIKLWVEGDVDLFADNPTLYVPVERDEEEDGS
jgi:hypothetical protein